MLAGFLERHHKEDALDGPLKRIEQRANLSSSHAERQVSQTLWRDAGCHEKLRIVEHPTVSASDIAACFIGAFVGLVAAALLISFLG